MQTINQQRNLKKWTEIMQDVRPDWEHKRNGHPCRMEDFEADRASRHVPPKTPEGMVFKACAGIVVVFAVLSWAGVV